MTLALTADVLNRLWPHALPGMVEGVSSASAAMLAKYGIVTLRDLIDFVAECSEETGGMTRVVESGAYTAQRAHEVWPRLFPTVADAVPFVMNERLLFNKTYGGRLGNRQGTDDGYNFRGRGMIQLTGRDWYARIGDEVELDLFADPDLVAAPEHVLECAAAYWKLAGVSKLANAGDFEGEVRRINGGLTNMPERLRWRALCLKILTPQAVMHITEQPQPAPAPAVAKPGVKPVTDPIKAAARVALAPAPTHAPTVTQNVVIDWGSWISQALVHETPIIEAAAQAGATVALASLPFGSIVSGFILPKLVKQYVDMGLTAMEGAVDGKSVSVPSGGIAGFLATLVENLMQQGESTWLGALDVVIGPLIKAEIASRGL